MLAKHFEKNIYEKWKDQAFKIVLLVPFMKIDFQKWPVIFEIFVNKVIRKLPIIRHEKGSIDIILKFAK